MKGSYFSFKPNLLCAQERIHRAHESRRSDVDVSVVPVILVGFDDDEDEDDIFNRRVSLRQSISECNCDRVLSCSLTILLGFRFTAPHFERFPAFASRQTAAIVEIFFAFYGNKARRGSLIRSASVQVNGCDCSFCAKSVRCNENCFHTAGVESMFGEFNILLPS